jgi:hypothetical protein
MGALFHGCEPASSFPPHSLSLFQIETLIPLLLFQIRTGSTVIFILPYPVRLAPSTIFPPVRWQAKE